MLILLALRLTLAAICLYLLAATFYIIFTEKKNYDDQSKFDHQRVQKKKTDRNENEDDKAHTTDDDDDGAESQVSASEDRCQQIGHHEQTIGCNGIRRRTQ